MRIAIFNIVLLLLLSCGEVLAQKGNLTGVYTGTYNCGTTQFGVQLKIIHHPDHMLSMMVASSAVGSYRKSNIGVRGVFKGFGVDIVLESPRMNDRMIINPSSEKQLNARLTAYRDRCSDFTLKRDSHLSKQLLSEMKNEQKTLAKNTHPISLDKIGGFWVMDSKLRSGEEYRLIVENDQAWLQRIGAQGDMIPLTPEQFLPDFNQSNGGAIVFRLAPDKAQSLDFDKVRITVNPRPYNDRSGGTILGVELLSFELEWKSIGLFMPTSAPSAGPTMTYTGSFIYQDWRDKDNSVPSSVNEVEARRRLIQTMTRLNQNGGWRCLSQRTITVTPNEARTLSWNENLTQRLYLIYSPHGNSELVYKFDTQTTKYVTGLQYDYPFFVAAQNVGTYKETVITFTLKPSTSKSGGSPKEIPVTVFRLFGNAPGDYGQENCNY